MTIFLVAIVLLAIVLGLLKKYRQATITFFIFSFLFLLDFSGILYAGLRMGLVSRQWEALPLTYVQNNAIVLLGGGLDVVGTNNIVFPRSPMYLRMVRAAMTYQDCKRSDFYNNEANHLAQQSIQSVAVIRVIRNCKIIISGGKTSKQDLSEADVYKNYLINLGVPIADILLEDRSRNTYENAQYVQQMMQQQKFEKIFLVTNATHMKRAMLYFKNFGMLTTPVLADFMKPQVSYWTMSYNLPLTDNALNEYIGMARLFIYNALGWNKEKNNL